jgi:hypothetical protein
MKRVIEFRNYLLFFCYTYIQSVLNMQLLFDKRKTATKYKPLEILISQSRMNEGSNSPAASQSPPARLVLQGPGDELALM